MLHRHSGFLLALFAATGFASKAIFAKLAYRYGVDAITLVTIRLGLALPFLLLMRLLKFRGERPLSKSEAGWVLLLGFLGYYLSSLLDFWGLESVSASIERMLLCLYPTLTVLLNARLNGSKISQLIIRSLLLTYLGVALVLAPGLAHGKADLLGIMLIIGSTTSYALYLTWSPQIISRIGAMRFTELALLVSAIIMICHFLAVKPVALLMHQPQEVWFYGLVMTLFSTLLPVYALSAAIDRIGSSKTAIIATLGPILTILMSMKLLDETLTAGQWAGVVLVMVGVWQVNRRGK